MSHGQPGLPNNILLGSIIEVMLVTAGLTVNKHLQVDGGLQV